MAKFPKYRDHEVIELNLREEVLRFACCDCGSVHKFLFGVKNRNNIQVRFVELKRVTAQLRRHDYGYLQQGKNAKYKMVKVKDG